MSLGFVPQFTPILFSGHRRVSFLTLSNVTIGSASSVGTVIGDFAVINGSTRAYTFSLTSNPGNLFSVSGSTLAVAAALSAGTDPIAARASDTGTSVVTGSFSINVISTAAAAFTPTWPYFGF